MFDYQKIFCVRLTKEQPDLDSLVRLFLSFWNHRSSIILKGYRNLRPYYVTGDEGILGKDTKNFELRVYFIKLRHPDQRVFIILTLNSMTVAGFVQSLCLRIMLTRHVSSAFRSLMIPFL